jgi:hypothetical protein
MSQQKYSDLDKYLIVYLATPIAKNTQHPEYGTLTPWAVFTNCYEAHLVARALWKKGYVVIAPSSNTMFMDGDDIIEGTYYYGDLAIVKRCDVVLMNAGWEESKGCNLERMFAIDNNIPVFYSIEDLDTWAIGHGYEIK